METFRPFACALALVLAGGNAWSQGLLDRIANRQQLTIGYSETSPPFSFVQDGAPAGYSIDLCRQVAQRVQQQVGKPGFRVTWVRVDQDRLPRLLEDGAVDLMCAGVSDTPARHRTMAFSEPIFLSSVKLLVRSDGGPRDLMALKGKTVTVLGRTTAEGAVQRLSDEKGIPVRLSRVVSPDAALSQLRLRQADAWARDEVLLLGAIAREPDAKDFTLLEAVLADEPIAIALPQDSAMRKLVNASLAEDVRSGRMEALYEQWFVRPNAASATGLKLALPPVLKARFDKMR